MVKRFKSRAIYILSVTHNLDNLDLWVVMVRVDSQPNNYIWFDQTN